ncbi:MAG TPA: exodeoxyribonuclease VII large subunit [Bacteroidales bacterium]|nr:exodeoxyribonuclease VII large subunit [Bacteroidales bacterium]HOL98203.1 exodeoxyribonuclease VII large subunit [Bacteroidales bacterium]HPD23900.1 exodeoxyribonuclease VII large subunit [Bacteroidales bacterium]HRS99971.1 exodeoxyribonuclease VII large subunit [Bacteroidales bacterium]HRT79996.1 exodeoxyribonuclease VII large subunit [Bacteroidales bacterium]
MSSSAISLYELNNTIKAVINSTFDSEIWVVAEINNINLHRSGHCYLELVQKAKNSDTVIAQARATIWASQYRYIAAYFRSATNSDLTRGISVMLKVIVDFHEVYGFSLNIRDIDPSYTLGDLERRKKEIIDKLIAEGVFDMNKKLPLPEVIKNVAVISSPTAAGYEDFLNQIVNNKFSYKWNIQLFEADMQGEKTEKSVINSLELISSQIHNFDIVCIIRGGGSKIDLGYFDNYNIAYHITQFPIPVITGIGHERDETISDMVANTKLKTPTTVAEFLINYNRHFEENMEEIYQDILSKSREIILGQKTYITSIVLVINKTKDVLAREQNDCNEKFFILKSISKNLIKTQINKMETASEIINNKTVDNISNQNYRIENLKTSLNKFYYRNYLQIQNNLFSLEKRISLSDPKLLLKRGFSITKCNGKIIKNTYNVKNGDLIETILYSGKISSKVLNIQNEDNEN